MPRENERIAKDISAVEKSCSDLTERWFQWADVQDAKRSTFEDKIFEKIENIREAVNQKDEVLGALVLKVNTVHTELAMIREELKSTDLSKLKADVDEAHERWRGLEPRVNLIEVKLPTFWTREQHDAAGEKRGISVREWVLIAVTALAIFGGVISHKIFPIQKPAMEVTHEHVGRNP